MTWRERLIRFCCGWFTEHTTELCMDETRIWLRCTTCGEESPGIEIGG